jgi:hypothetical protein
MTRSRNGRNRRHNRYRYVKRATTQKEKERAFLKKMIINGEIYCGSE